MPTTQFAEHSNDRFAGVVFQTCVTTKFKHHQMSKNREMKILRFSISVAILIVTESQKH